MAAIQLHLDSALQHRQVGTLSCLRTKLDSAGHFDSKALSRTPQGMTRSNTVVNFAASGQSDRARITD
jgi:hypothetical protein